jgi:uncharacterized membrane protein YbaN (DUF454 family)
MGKLNMTIRSILRIVVGIALIVIGLTGIIVPLLPGWPFIASGVILLWPKSRLAMWLKRLSARLKEWFHKKRHSQEAKRLTAASDSNAPKDSI